MKRRLRNILSPALSAEDLAYVYNSYDIVGDIAIVRLADAFESRGKTVAEAIVSVHKNVKTVLAQTGSVQGDFRLRRLEYIAGEKKTTTVHKEFGCSFYVDVEKCYFSPRLFHERMRIAGLIRSSEVVVNMFAGVGCFSIIVAKHSNAEKAYSIDVNPSAVKYMQENIRANRVYGKVVPILGDARKIIEKRFRHSADRILMPLPEKAIDYLPYALVALRNSAGWMHYYGFEHAGQNENPVEKARLKVAGKLADLGVTFEVPFGRVVRSTGPNWYQIVLDIKAGLYRTRTARA